MSGYTGVEAEVMLRIAGTGEVVSLVVSLSYFDTDPYAVTVRFHVGLDKPVEWTFARELLRDGQRAPVGDGDVRIWPRPGSILGVRLASPYGQAIFDFPARKVSEFLRATYRLVPEDGETGTVGRELDGLFLPGGALWEGGRA